MTLARSRPRRRDVLAGLGALALGACERRPPPPARPVAPPWRELAFPAADGPEQRALVLAPEGASRPVLVALHGRGESGRGLDVGARAWRDDYDLDRLHRRLAAPPLTTGDLLGLVTAERLARLNASLAAAPYLGLCVACPYTPDLPDKSAAGAAGFARFVIDRLLPKVRAEHGGSAEPRATGIDGVSMGGRLALLVGLSHPDVFASVGALQPALRVAEAPAFAALAREATRRARVALRLVSSEGDPFLAAVRALSESLRAEGVVHELVVGPGPHDYVWNRGPGSAELLIGHERSLRGLAAP